MTGSADHQGEQPTDLCIECDGWNTRVKRNVDRNGICICSVEELPSWHFRHRRIKFGYRYCSSSYWSALMTFFYWHNESINTWSHILAPTGIFLYFAANWPELVSLSTGRENDLWILAAVILLGNVIPLFCSAFCHTFYCVDKVCIHCLQFCNISNFNDSPDVVYR